MKTIVGVQFKNACRVYYFDPQGKEYKVGDFTIVETVRGLELGKVIIANRTVEDEDFSYELKPIIRKATYRDLENEKKHEEMAPKAFEVFKHYVGELELPMKPLYCEYTIDSQKLVFYYSAEDRVDFRELLKLLTPNFKLRLELRQVGAREAAAIVGGIGNCGRVICCKYCINNFDFVTMKMAKDQNMSLNISKISGLCGKLMCCIGFEHKMYQEVKKFLPKVGQYVKTPKVEAAKVVSIDHVKLNVQVLENPDGNPITYSAKELGFVEELNPMENEEKVVVSYNPENDEIKEEIKEETLQVPDEKNEDDSEKKKQKYLKRFKNNKNSKSKK